MHCGIPATTTTHPYNCYRPQIAQRNEWKVAALECEMNARRFEFFISAHKVCSWEIDGENASFAVHAVRIVG